MHVRNFVKKVHLLFALVTAIPLFTAGVSGAMLVYFKPLDHLANQAHADIQAGAQKKPLDELIEAVKREHPEIKFSGVSLQKSNDRAYQFWGSDSQERGFTVFMNPYTAEATAAFSTDRLSKETAISWLMAFHYSLQAGDVGLHAVGISTVLLMFSLLTGLILWFPKTLSGLTFKLRPRIAKRWKQNAYNWHSALGFYLGSGLFLIAISGVSMVYGDAVRAAVFWITRSAAPKEIGAIAPDPSKPQPNMQTAVATATLYLQRTYAKEIWPEWIGLPTDKNVVSAMWFQSSEAELHGLTSYSVQINSQDGTLLQTSAPETRNAGESLFDWIGPMHYGSWGDLGGPWLGQFSRILWIFVALMPPFLIVTGMVIWRKPAWYRNFKKRRG